MGLKEEKRQVRIIFGFAGQSKPEQVNVGNCHVCKLEVWMIPTSSQLNGDYELKFVHHSCR